MSVKKNNPGYTIALTSAVILSTTGIFIAYLSREYSLPALILSFWREFLVSLILMLFIGIRNPRALLPGWKKVPFYLLYGFVLAVFNGIWTFSVALNGAALATFLVYTSPVFTALLGSLLLKEKMTLLHWFCISLSMTGCLLISDYLSTTDSGISITGLAVGLLSGFAYALYTIQGRKAGQHSSSTEVWSSLCWIFGIASLFMLLFILILRALSFSPGVLTGNLFHLGKAWKGWMVLLLLAGLPTLSGYGLYNLSLKYLPSLTVSLLASTEPVFTALLAYLLLKETLTISALTGSIFILSSVFLIQSGSLLSRVLPSRRFSN